MITRRAAALAGAFALLAIPAFASADFSWDFNTVISGDTPGGDAPWANLTGVQNGSNVDFTLTFFSFVGPGDDTEFLNSLDLQYNGDLTGSSIIESEAGIVDYEVGGHTNASIHFDALVDFENANNGNRIEPGDTVFFTITGVDADNYTFGMLHINGTAGFEGSSKVGPVPEPASMAALGIGALGLLARRRRK